MIKKNEFTVVIPVHNAENTISETLESVLNQTYKANQVIIVDDGSTDRSAELIKNMQENHLEIEYFYQPNRGVSAARNIGIQKSRNENVFFIDSDDYWLKNKIELHNAHLLKHIDCTASFTNFISADMNNGNFLHKNRYINHRPITSVNLALNLARINGSASSFLGKRKILVELSGFDEELFFGEDLDLWVRYAKNYSICDLHETCTVIRFNKVFSKYSAKNVSVSDLYLKLWDKIEIDFIEHELKLAARRILRIDIRRNITNLKYVLCGYPLMLQKFGQNYYKLIYKNRLGYVLFLIYDTFFDFLNLLTRLARR